MVIQSNTHNEIDFLTTRELNALIEVITNLKHRVLVLPYG